MPCPTLYTKQWMEVCPACSTIRFCPTLPLPFDDCQAPSRIIQKHCGRPGTELYMYRGKCSRCKDFVPRSEAGPVALSTDHGQVALSFLLCRPCLNWLVERCVGEARTDGGANPTIRSIAVPLVVCTNAKRKGSGRSGRTAVTTVCCTFNGRIHYFSFEPFVILGRHAVAEWSALLVKSFVASTCR